MKCRTLTSRLMLGAALGSLAACGDPRLQTKEKPVEPTGASQKGLEAPLDVTAYVAHSDEAAGLPTFSWLETRSSIAPEAPPAEVAWRTLRGLPAVYKLDETALQTAKLRELHDVHNGPIIASFNQTLDGKDVFGGRIAIGLDRYKRPMVAAGHLSPQVRVLSSQWSIDGANAAQIALHALKTGFVVKTEPSSKQPEPEQLIPAGGLGDLVETTPASTKQVYFPTRAGLVPAHYVELDVARPDGVDGHMYAFVVSAEDGAILFAIDQTQNDSYTYKVFADDSGDYRPFDSPHGNDYTPHPTGTRDGMQPMLVSPKTVKLQNLPFSKNDPWLPSGATEANGNNVWAYADISAPDGWNMGDVALNTSATGTFDYAVDVTMDPAKDANSRRAVTTNLFYIINFMHDYFYDAGWNEASYNAQKSNFGRGGTEMDAIKAESQDSSGRNNANASTPADGRSPRIQMYLFDVASSQAKVTAPMDLAGVMKSGAASGFGPTAFSITGDLVLGDDGVNGMGMPAGTANDGCETPWKNAAAIAGKIAVIDRGFCPFVQKVKNAQTAGAIGAIVLNNVAGEGPRGMTGTDNTITIPALGLSKEDGDKIKAKFMAGTTVTMAMNAQKLVRDGSLDTTIVSHEWGHVLTNRLVGNSIGLSSLQGRGMGEGWGDFTALLTIVRPEDAMVAANADWKGVYPTGSHALAAPGNDAFYDGIRRYPYSTDMKKNPLTFKHIEDGVALPMSPAPTFGADGASNSEVHNTGEVWATMMWEAYTALLKDTARYTFAQANQRVREYYVAGLKLTPNAPTFLEARDAFLAAARASDLKDFVILYQAFAKRGAGMGATGPSRTAAGNHTVKESFTVDPDIEIVGISIDSPTPDCDKDGILDPGDTGKLTIKLRNIGGKELAGPSVTVTADGPTGPLILVKGSPAMGAKIDPLATGEIKLDVELSKDAKQLTSFDLKIAITDANLPMGKAINATYEGLGSYDDVDDSSTTDSFDSAKANAKIDWKPLSVAGMNLDTSQPWVKNFRRANGVWHGSDSKVPADNQLISPTFDLADAGPFTLTIKHRFDFEAAMGKFFDGGVIEISEDAGKTWTDVEKLIKSGGYSGKLEASMKNPLTARNAFSGRSMNYGDAATPGYVSTVVELGDAYKGKSVQLRFRIGTDEADGALGWDVDEIAWTGLKGKPFPSRTANKMQCSATDKLTVAIMGPMTAISGMPVQLVATASGAQGTVTYTWTQEGGPDLQLPAEGQSQSFTAPTVTEPTPIALKVVAKDSVATSEPATLMLLVTPLGSTDMPPGTDAPGCSCSLPGSPRGNGSPLGAAAVVALGAALAFRRRRKLLS